METKHWDVEAFISSLDLADFEVFQTSERQPCDRCGSRKMVYCDKCMRLLAPREKVPQVQLPLQVDVLKHIGERSSKSSVIPLAFLAPETCRIISCLPNDRAIPDYSPLDTVLVFPSDSASSLGELSLDLLQGLKRVVFIDSTWNQTVSMTNSASLQHLPAVRLSKYCTMFWRLQSESKEFLSTVEAIYYFLVEYTNELHHRGLKDKGYDGEFDNLLWHYVYTYQLIQQEYTQGRKRGKPFKKSPGYIQQKNDPAE